MVSACEDPESPVLNNQYSPKGASAESAFALDTLPVRSRRCASSRARWETEQRYLPRGRG